MKIGESFYLNNEIINENNNIVAEGKKLFSFIELKKDGFYLEWELNKEIQIFLKNKFNINVEKIICHLKIWTKIFYLKHKNSFYNTVLYNEQYLLNNIINIINDEIIKNNNSFSETKKNKGKECIRIEFKHKFNYTKKDKEYCFVYIFILNKSDKYLTLISLHRRK